jgi:hypothetical protein
LTVVTGAETVRALWQQDTTLKRRNIMKGSVIAQAALVLGLSSSHAPAETAYFSLVSTGGVRTAPHEFVFGVSDTDTIATLRDIVVNAGDIPPRNQRITGRIVTSRMDYNAEWPFHLVPSTVRLTEGLDTEACDATPFEIEDNLSLVGGAFLPGSRWCPWSMRLVREVAPAAPVAR